MFCLCNNKQGCVWYLLENSIGSYTTFQYEVVAQFGSCTTFQSEVVAHFGSCTTPGKLRNVLHQLCSMVWGFDLRCESVTLWYIPWESVVMVTIQECKLYFNVHIYTFHTSTSLYSIFGQCDGLYLLSTIYHCTNVFIT